MSDKFLVSSLQSQIVLVGMELGALTNGVDLHSAKQNKTRQKNNPENISIAFFI